MAQEVYEIIPEATTKPVDEGYDIWTITYSKLVPVLVKAVQEPYALVVELRNDIAALREQVTTVDKEHDSKIQNLQDQTDVLRQGTSPSNRGASHVVRARSAPGYKPVK